MTKKKPTYEELEKLYEAEVRKRKVEVRKLKIEVRKRKVEVRKHKARIRARAAAERKVERLAGNDIFMMRVLANREVNVSWKKIGKKYHVSGETVRKAAITRFGYKVVKRAKKGRTSAITIMNERTLKLIEREKLPVSLDEYVTQKY